MYGTPYHQKKAGFHGNAKWTKEKIGEIIADIKSGLRHGEAAKKHGIRDQYLSIKIQQYHAGELK